ncbi:amidohydrolase family protein [Streptomyces sp. NPDC102360]|uniref:amidohydrolase family protein n=1 Tax=Streptomyces sp. NPDC102360 TaxID=3366160 RepID=UPI00380D839D
MSQPRQARFVTIPLQGDPMTKTTRRSLLTAGAGAATGAFFVPATAPSAQAAPLTPTTDAAGGRAIDTHAHVYPAKYLDLLEQIGVPASTTAIARGIGADSTDEDLSARLRWMDRANVETQIIAVTPQVPSGPDGASSLAAARQINDEYAGLVQRHAGRFLAYGTLPLPHVEESLAEIPRLFDDLGVVGVSLTTVLPGGLSPADRRFDPVWQALNERAAIVNIHATGSGALSSMITEHQLEWVNGAPVEDATSVLHILKADIPRRFPDVRFHIAHLGGDLPFLAQRIEDNYTDWQAFPVSPLDTLRTMWFDAANFHTPSLRLTVETFGADRIMAGSDHPYFQEDKYVRAFDYIRKAPLAPDEVSAILAGNATALYKTTSKSR